MNASLAIFLGIAERAKTTEAKDLARQTNDALDAVNSTLEEIASSPRPLVELVRRAHGEKAFGDGPDKIDRRVEPR